MNMASGVHMETWIDTSKGSGFKLEAQFDYNGNASPDCKKVEPQIHIQNHHALVLTLYQ